MLTKNFWTLMGVLVAVEVLGGSCRRAAPTAPAPAASPIAAVVAPAGPSLRSNGAAGGGVAGGVVNGSRVAVVLTTEGFVPNHIPAEAGKPVTLAITRKTDKTCAREILIKGQPGKTDLPLDKEVEVTITPKASGTVPFGCAMGMMVGGVLEVR